MEYPSKIWKHGGATLANSLLMLIKQAWKKGTVPQEWKNANIVTIYKKGDRTLCGNYRGISLLSIAGKAFARILLNRLNAHITPEVVPESQCGFRSNRSTVDMIFCLRQLQEKCIEHNRPLYVVFVNFTKAFDTVGRTGLWQLLKKYGCPEKFTKMIKSLHTGMTAKVKEAAKTKTTQILARELLFVDDSALVAHTPEQMQRVLDAFSSASKRFGLQINIKKTEVLFQPSSTHIVEEDILVDGTALNRVADFTYLGSTISDDAHIDQEKSWTLYRSQVKKLHTFMMRHLQQIMRSNWQDRVTNKEILHRADLPSMEDLLIRKNLRWTGHIIRMPTDRLPRQLLFSQLPVGERKIGRPRLRYKYTIKRNLKKREINIKTSTLAYQRAKWRSAVK
ncbi:uncharacterized protein LOC134765962 [Penaeus indicus]|uniref:uncharacterized protein LOC134765962 n=1 Tax=Penaeus indicus TaxID=29960 RepID=UPI00300C697A